MNTLPIEHMLHDFIKHIHVFIKHTKEHWVESIIFCIFFVALMYLVLSSAVSVE